jgi:hypothetical protein
MHPILSPIRATCQAHLILLDLINRIMFGSRLHGFVSIVTIHTLRFTKTCKSRVSILLFRFFPLSTVAVYVTKGTEQYCGQPLMFLSFIHCCVMYILLFSPFSVAYPCRQCFYYVNAQYLGLSRLSLCNTESGLSRIRGGPFHST